MRKQQFEDKLAQLKKIAPAPITDDAVTTLREVLSGAHALLASMACQIAGRRRIQELIPDVVAAFDRAMPDADKGCQVKIAVVEALQRLEYLGDEVYLRGVRHVQMEPAFGGPVDVAADLRAECAVALANMQHPLARLELTALLADPELNPRRAAVRALGHLGGEASECLLRLKALAGDDDVTITGECLAALISIEPERSVEFVSRFLDKDLPTVEQAALALGQSHELAAFEALRQRFIDNPSPQFRHALLLPIALMRMDAAFEFLVEFVRNSGGRLAADAVRALGIYSDDASRRRIREAVEHRNDPLCLEALRSEFGEG